MVLNAKELRVSHPKAEDLSQIRRNPLVIVLDGILDTFNIGSFFRLADAVAAEKIILCGPTVTPPNIKIHRASVGTWKWVPWEQQRSAIPAILKLKKEGYQTIAIEQTKKSTPYHLVKYPKKLALVLGNESDGISPAVLKVVDQKVEIPMLGINRSLNVLVSASAVIYHYLESTKTF